MCIVSTVVFPIYTGFQNELVLKTTANEIMSALHLAQQSSIDESREYCVEFIGSRIRVREYKVGGRIIFIKDMNPRIEVSKESFTRISSDLYDIENIEFDMKSPPIMIHGKGKKERGVVLNKKTAVSCSLLYI